MYSSRVATRSGTTSGPEISVPNGSIRTRIEVNRVSFRDLKRPDRMGTRTSQINIVFADFSVGLGIIHEVAVRPV